MTTQIFLKGGQIWKINHDMVTATDNNATGTIAYYYSSGPQSVCMGKQIFTTAASGGMATATAASATVEATDSNYVIATIPPMTATT
jgi:hypothetical protein